MENLHDKLGEALTRAMQNAPISDTCPLADNPKWNCRPHDKGNESCCKSIAGYSRCSHYLKWFYFILSKAIAKELAANSVLKETIPKKKKKQKEN